MTSSPSTLNAITKPEVKTGWLERLLSGVPPCKTPIVLNAANEQTQIKIHIIPTHASQSYLIEAASGLILVDTGPPGNETKILQTIKKTGQKKLNLILITHAHFDHYGSAAAVHKITGAPIAIHPADAEAMAKGQTKLGHLRSLGKLGKPLLDLTWKLWKPEPTQADLTVEAGRRLDKFGINGKVLHSPGHTPGSITFLLDTRYAFTGDLISSRFWVHKQRFYATDWSQLEKSLERIRCIKPDLLFPGHGAPFETSKLWNK